MTGERVEAVTVARRYGAYLIEVASIYSLTEHAGPQELCEAASSLPVAKRLARSMATEFGFVGPWRWRQPDPSRLRWELECTIPEEDDDDE